MKKNKLTKNDKQGIMIIIILFVLIAIVIGLIFNSAKEEKKTYEYALNNEIYQSEECFYKDDAYCMKEREIVRVDNYYEVEK